MKWEWIFLAASIPLWGLAAAWSGLLETKFPSHTESKGGQIEALEVLRGFAAFAVFEAHVTMYFGALAPGSRASSYFGNLGVIIFFMLTGFLFWGQVLKNRLALETFIAKRIRRLVPLCVFVVTSVLLTDWLVARCPMPTLGNLQAAAHNYSFGFRAVEDVFRPDIYLRLNTVWSLKWEWLFYLCLPLFAIKRTYLAMSLGAAALVAGLYDVKDLIAGNETEACFVIAFFLGAIGNLVAPGTPAIARLRPAVRRAAGAILLIAFVALSIARYFQEGSVEARVRHLSFVAIASLLFYVFVLFAAEGDRLSSSWLGRAAMQLGRVSYSLYLWQLAVIYYVIPFALRDQPFFATAGGYFGITAALIVLTVTVSHFSYRDIELRFMKPAR